MPGIGSTEEFIEDAKRHNQWWNDGTSPELSRATELTPRSDFHNVLKRTNTHYTDDVERLVYAIYGQTGIGKTTLLHQLIAALLDTTEFPHRGREFALSAAISPRQILYIPLEDSLYQLEPPGDGIDRLTQVVDYFQTHVAPRQGPRFILLDDVQALDLTEARKAALLSLLDEHTYLFLTGIVEQQTDLSGLDTAASIDAFEGPRPILPMKFIDTVQTGDGLGAAVDSELREKLASFQSEGLDGSSPIKIFRDALDLRPTDTEIGLACDMVRILYNDALDPTEQDALHDAARVYLRKGGTLHRTDDPSIRNEITKSHFLLFLYKELARYRSIQKPENLHRLSSLAASHAGEELQYTDISDQIGVDRRTVDSYLHALDEGIAVTESHDYALRRYRRTRLYLRNPRHLVLLSQRREHDGFEDYDQQATLNHEFEYKLARTVAFDHAMRLAFYTGAGNVEYTTTDSGLVDFILHRDGQVVPFVLSYPPYTDNAESIAMEFDPSEGQHTSDGSEELRDLEYEAPYRFIITDGSPQKSGEEASLVVRRDDITLCYLPYWLFLLIC